LHRYPGPLARTWRSPVHSCRVASPQAPTPDRESLPATIAQSIRVGPHPGRLDGALGATNSSAPLRNCAEAFDTAGPSQSHEQAKVPDAIFTEPSAELIRAVVGMKQRNPNWGCPRIAQQIPLAFHIQIDKDVVRRILAHHHRPGQDSGGPSWLTFLGHMKDSLWSIDLFRCESATLRTLSLPKMPSGGNGFEISDMEKMKVRPSQIGDEDVTMLDWVENR
jgi:hypothetical protein